MSYPLLRRSSLAVAVAGLLLAASSAHAQARTWVSGVGDDVNPCSRTAPCKTFAGAISKTAAGGEINVLDPGGFGAVTITKSISIVAEGLTGGISATGINGIIINAGAADNVTLRGLDIFGAGTGLDGIRILNAGGVVIDNCLIGGFTGDGIEVAPNAASGTIKVAISNSVFRNNGGAVSGGGLTLKGSATVALSASVENTFIEKGGHGLRVEANATVTAKNVTSTLNERAGFISINSGAALGTLVIENSVASSNGGSGVVADGVNSLIRLRGSSVVGNQSGIRAQNSGLLVSFGGNVVAGNPGGDAIGAPTSTVGPI